VVDLVMRGACPDCSAGEVTLAETHRTLTALNGGDVRLNLLSQVWIPPWNQPVLPVTDEVESKHA
jgi:hypothetical protein